MLSLDDPRWNSLGQRNYPPDEPYARDVLAYLMEHPEDQARFGDFWPVLCSEGTAWGAAFAAVPYVVHIAQQLPAVERTEHLAFIGLVVGCSHMDGEQERILGLEDFLAADYKQALTDTMALLAETLLAPLSPYDARYMLATAAAIKVHPRLGEALWESLFHTTCPECHKDITVELQELTPNAPR